MRCLALRSDQHPRPVPSHCCRRRCRRPPAPRCTPLIQPVCRPEPLYHGIPAQLPGSAGGSLPEVYRRLLLAVDTASGGGSGSGGSGSSTELLATRAIKLPDEEYPDWAAIGDPRPSWQRSRNESVAAVAALNANTSRRAGALSLEAGAGLRLGKCSVV